MEGISNHYIDSILRPTCTGFHGVFSADTIPTNLLRYNQFSIVCNLSKAGEPGSHFISIIVFPNRVLYIDSFGLPCVVQDIINFIRQLKRPIFYNYQQVQDVSSPFCGFYCILFVLYFTYVSTTLQFERKHLLQNDTICVNKIREILNKSVY